MTKTTEMRRSGQTRRMVAERVAGDLDDAYLAMARAHEELRAAAEALEAARQEYNEAMVDARVFAEEVVEELLEEAEEVREDAEADAAADQAGKLEEAAEEWQTADLPDAEEMEVELPDLPDNDAPDLIRDLASRLP